MFAELTYHAAYEPQRAVRTKRWKYIRRFGDRLRPVLPNVDDSPTKDLLLQSGWGERELPREELYDLRFDPVEAANLIEAPRCAEVADELRERLDRWMHETADPLLDGPVPAPEGAELNDPDQISPAEPANGHVLDPGGVSALSRRRGSPRGPAFSTIASIDPRPRAARQVVAHALDLQQPGARDRARGRAPARGPHQRVGGAVDDERRGADRAQLPRAVARREDGRELARAAGGVAPAVVAPARQPAQLVRVAREAGRADRGEHRDGVLDVGLAVLRRRAPSSRR